MDKLATELATLLQDLLAAHQRQFSLAQARQDAMRSYDVALLSNLMEREDFETRSLEGLELRRRDLIARFRRTLGFEPTASQVAEKVDEPLKSQLLGLAGKLRATLEQIDRINRTNAKISQAVVKSLAKVLKIITGVAQHVGLYNRNGRKAALAGIHILELTA